MDCSLSRAHSRAVGKVTRFQVPDLDCFCVVVIDGLDRLKKENAGARDGIRFLESEFRKGNR